MIRTKRLRSTPALPRRQRRVGAARPLYERPSTSILDSHEQAARGEHSGGGVSRDPRGFQTPFESVLIDRSKERSISGEIHGTVAVRCGPLRRGCISIISACRRKEPKVLYRTGSLADIPLPVMLGLRSKILCELCRRFVPNPPARCDFGKRAGMRRRESVFPPSRLLGDSRIREKRSESTIPRRQNSSRRRSISPKQRLKKGESNGDSHCSA